MAGKDQSALCQWARCIIACQSRARCPSGGVAAARARWRRRRGCAAACVVPSASRQTGRRAATREVAAPAQSPRRARLGRRPQATTCLSSGSNGLMAAERRRGLHRRQERKAKHRQREDFGERLCKAFGVHLQARCM